MSRHGSAHPNHSPPFEADSTGAVTLVWTTYKGTHPRGIRQHGSVGKFVEFVTAFHTEYVKENAPGFSPTIYSEHYTAVTPRGSFSVEAPSVWRCAAGVQAITALVLDLDHHPPDWAALANTGNFLVLYSTWSHAQDDPRWRLVAPLASPIGVEQQAALWRAGVERFAPRADAACKDPSRFYFVHSAPPQRAAQAEVRILDGELWAPRGLEATAKDGDRDVEYRDDLDQRRGGSGLPLGWLARDFIEYGVDIGQQRPRALAAARNLLAAGYSVENATRLIWQGLERSPQEAGRKPWTEDEAERIVCDLAAAPPTPLSPMAPTPRVRRMRLVQVG